MSHFQNNFTANEMNRVQLKRSLALPTAKVPQLEKSSNSEDVAITNYSCFVRRLLLSILFISQTGSIDLEAIAQESNEGAALILSRTDLGVLVRIGSEEFTQFDAATHQKPIFFPVFAPDQIPMTRSRPMIEQDGEAADHPHHKSIWFAHGAVNGVDFWSEKGQIKNIDYEIVEGNGTHSIVANNEWRSKTRTELHEQTAYSFGFDDRSRWIDFDIRLSAIDQDAIFGDTKEGMMALRVHPGLRLHADPKQGVAKVYGKIINSAGDKDSDAWGKRSAWVRYDGIVNDTQVAILFCDHPDNLRHPTTWHARDYGLFAANPFGLHDFGLGPEKAGEYKLEKGKSLRFRYRIVFANLKFGALDSESVFNDFTQTK